MTVKYCSNLVAPVVESIKALYSKIKKVERDVASVQMNKADQVIVDDLRIKNADLEKRISQKEQEIDQLKMRLDKIEKKLMQESP